MRYHLMSLGWKVRASTQEEYKIGDQVPTYPKELGKYDGNAKALNAILNGLTNTIFTKFMRCNTAKQSWDKLLLM